MYASRKETEYYSHRKHCFLCRWEGMFTAPLPKNRSIHCRGNVFSDPLPSSGLIRNNINMELREIGWGCMNWIDLAQDRDQWRALLNTVMNHQVP
jgi:hypothetical protein